MYAMERSSFQYLQEEEFLRRWSSGTQQTHPNQISRASMLNILNNVQIENVLANDLATISLVIKIIKTYYLVLTCFRDRIK